MKKIVCLLLSLCLWAGLAFPAFPALAADGDIRPYTVNGNFDGVPFSVTFSAATARKATVTQIFDDDVLDEDGNPTETQPRQVSVTVLTLCAGSAIKINQGLRFGDEYGDTEPYVLAMTGIKDSDGFHMFSMEPTYIHAGLAERLSWGYQYEDSGETYQYGHFIHTAGWDDTGEIYLLELGDTPAPPSADGYQGYTIHDGSFDLTFEAVRVETRKVSLRSGVGAREGADVVAEIGGYSFSEISDYEPIDATILHVKAGSQSFLRLLDESVTEDRYYVLRGFIGDDGHYTTAIPASGRHPWYPISTMSGPTYYLTSWDTFIMPHDEGFESGKHCYIIRLDARSSFADVKTSDYYAYPVAWAVNRGVTNGTTATTFSPHDPCTRAQILTFIWRYAGEPEPTVSNPFRDVSASNYYYKAALWAYQKGMASGSAFEGNTPCTRAAAVTYLWILAGRPEVEYERKSFADVPANSPYAKAVAYAVDAGITEGTSDTAFSPERVCSRAHIVTFLERYAIHQYYR